MPYFDRFDICEAYHALETDYHTGGALWERPHTNTHRESVGVQLSRLGFRPSPGFRGYESLTENGREIYDAAVRRLGLVPDSELRGIHTEAC